MSINVLQGISRKCSGSYSLYKKWLISAFISLAFFAANGQTLKGKVKDQSDTLKADFPGARVYWINTNIGTQTDVNGNFEITLKGIENKELVVAFFGYKTDTITIKDQSFITVYLQSDVSELEEVVIIAERNSSYISHDPIKTEVLTQQELGKSACCDLAGCFETQATVQPMTTNVITNSKELRILGLSGVYNQILIDGMPMVQGLSYTYGISSYPGTLVKSIYITKGANSVLQGFESITGSINVILKDPDQGEKFYVNAYMNSFLEKHFNVNYSKRWKKWSTLTAFHTVQPSNRFDRDKDNFLDIPLLTRYVLYNKWRYSDEDSLGFNTMIGLRYVNEKRTGGQTDFSESLKGSNSVYGQNVKIQQPEIYAKSGYRFNEYKKITLISAAFLQDQRSYFGTIDYKAQQQNLYANLQYELLWNYTHELKTGISYRYLNINENINFLDNSLGRTFDGVHKKNEIIPGIFAENSFKWKGDKIVLLTGLRLDYHNTFGYFLTPRSLIKYEIKPNTIVRANAGTGFRTINLFSENLNLLASSRDIVITEQLKPERAFNWGINLTQKLYLENVTGSISMDFYQTRFMNQIFPDYDADASKAIVSNFTGQSISNGFQVESNLKFYKKVEAKLAYTFLDVYRIIESEKVLLPFNAKHKVMTSLSYEPLSKAWHVDMNIHWYGKQRLPNTSSNPIEYRQPEESRSYTIASAQFTKVWKQFEVYTGIENIFDFRQLRPIVSWQNPFSPYFDTSFAWGPTRGREFYLGIRFRIQ